MHSLGRVGRSTPNPYRMATRFHAARPLYPGMDEQTIELATRQGGGIVVRLLWTPGEDSVRIAVEDGRTGEEFELEVARADAYDAYTHPFAYAAA